MNYLVDPYGYLSRNNKFVKNLTMFNKPHVTMARLNSDGYYYLIGTSRMAKVNPKIVEMITGKKTHNIKLDGATLRENSFIASKVKEKGKFFIYSLDAFSLNANRQNFKEINDRYEAYKNELSKNIFFSKYYNSDITIRSIQHLLKSLNKENINKQHIEENSRHSIFSIQAAKENSGVLNNVDKSNFSNYQSYSIDEITRLAELGSKDDIFIIFPKYFYYYALFSQYQEIENQYFSSIKLLVNHTEAKVWSFYGINDITSSENNFNDNGWHFKPQVSNIIFNEVFDYRQDSSINQSGVLLTKENIDSYLSNISKEINNIGDN